ncbi:MAG: glycosyltransferase [Candidatus Obscuribacterales bacterium]|nr:glycosyltransferase [Candidatus Obscuribacterales bacterium]
MKIAIVCNDTRGGVQPYVALAEGLRERGITVKAVAPGHLASLFSDRSFDVQSLSGSKEDVQEVSNRVAEAGTLGGVKIVLSELSSRIETWTAEVLAACEGTDAITGGIGGMFIGKSVAEKLNKPFIETHLQPIFAPSSSYPPVLLSALPLWLGTGVLRACHALSDFVLSTPFESAMKGARRKVLGLESRSAQPSALPVLYAVSPLVVPLAEETRNLRMSTGYWFLNCNDWQPPAGLESFLAGGDVVSVGFGSMTCKDAPELTSIVGAAVRKLGVRAVVLGGSGALTANLQTDDVYFLDEAPHDWLFSRVSACVHHGGAGTTAAGFRSGRPCLVVPFGMDQPFWGTRVMALGTGPKPIPRKRLTPDNLAQALHLALTDDSMKNAAQRVAQGIGSEDGAAVACRELVRIVHNW